MGNETQNALSLSSKSATALVLATWCMCSVCVWLDRLASILCMAVKQNKQKHCHFTFLSFEKDTDAEI